MYENECTLYLNTDDGYTVKHIHACHIQNVKAYEIKKYGSENADSIKVHIPLSALSGYASEWNIPEGSRIAEGNVEIPVTNDISALIDADVPVYIISSVTNRLYGDFDMKHIVIGAK